MGVFIVAVFGLALVGSQHQASGAAVSSKLCISPTQVLLTVTKTGTCGRSESKVTWNAETAKTVCITTSKALKYSRSGKCVAKTTSASKKALNGVLPICTKLSSRQILWRTIAICPKGFTKTAMFVSKEITAAMNTPFISASTVESGTTPSASLTTVTLTPMSTTVATLETTTSTSVVPTTTSMTVVPTTTSTTTTTIVVPTATTSTSTTSTSTTTTTAAPTATTSTSTTSTSTTSTVAPSTTTTVAPSTTTTVPGPAAITSFTTDDATINKGSSTQLRASFSGLTASVNNAVGAISAGGSVSVSPTVTTTYVLTVADADNTVTQSVTVYVNAVSIVVQPQSLVTASEAGSFFSVGASGIGTISYQWFKNDVSISGANSGTYRVTTNGDYKAVVTSTYRGVTMSVTSSVANYLINSATITSQPVDSSILLGNTHSFSVDATGTGALTYQWFLDNTVINSATSRIYIASTAGTYKVRVTSTVSGNVRTIDSNDAVLTLTSVNISSISPNAYVTQGGSTSLAISVSVSVGVSVTYQWQFNGADISGANSIGYLARQTGDYAVVVTATRNGVTQIKASSSTHVTAVAAPSITSFDSLASTIALGGSTDLVPVFANGTGVISPGNISVSSGDHVSVAPITTTTYTLTVTNAAGTSSGMSYSITVTTGTFTSVSSFSSTSRYQNSTSVTLADGRVLVYGAYDNFGTVKTDVFNPTTNLFSAVGDANFAWNESPGVLLANGKVLVAGGLTWTNNNWASTSTAGLFDPASNTWSATGSMITPRRTHFMIRLVDGRVFVGGGTSDDGDVKSAEIYDPVTEIFTSVPDMPETRSNVHAALLPNGNVLVVGGYNSGTGHLTSAVIYNVSSNSWSTVNSQMQTAHDYGAAIVALNDGRIFIAGGWDSTLHGISQTEIFDPSTNTFSAGPSLTERRADLTAHVLQDGKVVLIGGADGYGNVWNSVDIFDPVAFRVIKQVNTMSYERYVHSSALLADGRVIIVGGNYSGRFTADIFTQ